MPEFNYSLLKSYGDDVYISSNVVIKNPHLVTVGNHVAIDDFFYCTTAMEIGDFCHISSHVSIVGGKTAQVTMGNFSHLAAGARLIAYGDEQSSGHGLVSPVIPFEYRDTMIGGTIIIGHFVSILTNAVIVPGMVIPNGCIIGANSLANKNNLESWGIYVGSPCKFIKSRPKEKMIEYAKKLGYDYGYNSTN